jgi:hypothetical protein
MAEFNTPRLMVAAGEYSAYDGFKACKIVGARLATLLHDVKSVRIKGTTYLLVAHVNLPLRCVPFALRRSPDKRMKKCHSTRDHAWIHPRLRTGAAGGEQGL